MMGRGNTGPVYPWFGKDIRDGIPLAIENYAPAAPAVARGRRRLGGQVPHAAAGLHRDARARSTASRRSSGTARSAPPRSPSRPRTTATGSSPTTSSGRPSHTQQMVDLYRRRFEHYGHGSADQAIVGLGGQVFMRKNSQDAVREFRPYFDNAPVYGHGPSLEDFTSQTPLTVGSPQEVIERTPGLPGVRRRLPAPAVPDGPRRAAAQDRAGAARHPRRGGRAGAAQGVRGAAPGARPGRPDARLAARRPHRHRGGLRRRVADRTRRSSSSSPPG